MKSKFCLILIAASGITWLAAPQLSEHIPLKATTSVWNTWAKTVQLFAVPLALLVIGFSKHFVLKLLQLIWGLWLVIVSILMLWSLSSLGTQISTLGAIFIAFVTVLAFGLVLFTVIEMGPNMRKK